MDYDDIDYDEGYSIRDIDNDWFNGNMDYETDSVIWIIIIITIIIRIIGVHTQGIKSTDRQIDTTIVS